MFHKTMFILQIYSKCDNETICAWPTCGQVSSTQFKILFYRWGYIHYRRAWNPIKNPIKKFTITS
jgi:hypothetical protein